MVVNGQRVLEFMRDDAYRPLEAGEIMAALGVPSQETGAFLELLSGLELEGLVVRNRFGRYGVPERMNLVVGVFQGHEKGFGFVVPLQPGGVDLFIPPGAMNGAMHGDQVVARRSGRAPGGRSPEGEVIRILRRAHRTIVGVLEREKRRGFGFVIPDERRITYAVFVAGGDLAGARKGEKVVVEITRWPDARRGAEGRVIQRLGRPGDPGVDVLGVMHTYGLAAGFSAEAEREAAAVPEAVGPAELAGRWDLREMDIVTIDSEDAKDLDDAVSLQRLGDGGGWRLGVHIADVSYYVREGGALDREAAERGTSVYLVDRVLPMLPPRLSNGICSLNPCVDRLTMSVFIEFDAEGRPVKHEMGPSVIRSKARLTYEGVAAVLGEAGGAFAGGNAAASAVDERFVPMLHDMWQLAEILRRNRLRRGSIDFDIPEARVILDERGRPVEVKRRERNRAHQLIEEFMLAANATVAEYCAWLKVPFIYRVHEAPDEEKVEGLKELLFGLAIPFKPGREKQPKEFQRVLERIKGRPEEPLVAAVMLRSMKQARYAAENLGHFGLAARFYCHFTSPIRRYPDLIVHRVLKAALRGGPDRKTADRWAAVFPDLAGHSSSRERVAAEAEMETVKIKMVEYMADKVGEEFPALIAGVASFGFFVQLENLVEGLVHVSTLDDDYYLYDDKGHALIGERTGRRFRLGDRVRVRLARAAVQERQLDFLLVDR